MTELIPTNADTTMEEPMKVLTATRETQGWRDNDYCWAIEGELVLFVPIECGGGTVDDDCGCRRGMAGMTSHRATSTMKVVERNDLDRDIYFELVTENLKSQGYLTDALMESPEVNEWVHHLTDELIYLAAMAPVEAVLERRDDILRIRTPQQTLK